MPRKCCVQSEKMQALGHFAGGIAHDFNNLLGIIIGSMEFLRDAVRGSPSIPSWRGNPEQRTERIGADTAPAGCRTQPAAAAATRRSEGTAPGDVAMLRRTLGETIQIEARRSPDLWFTSADPSQIGDALLNLALNARDAMPHGGSLKSKPATPTWMHEALPRTSEMREEDYVVLTVADTGIGMPEAVAATGDRAILHDQASVRRFRPGPQHGLRLCQTVWRTSRYRKRRWRRDPDQVVFAARQETRRWPRERMPQRPIPGEQK